MCLNAKYQLPLVWSDSVAIFLDVVAARHLDLADCRLNAQCPDRVGTGMQFVDGCEFIDLIIEGPSRLPKSVYSSRAVGRVVVSGKS